jgi:hypothetical protein
MGEKITQILPDDFIQLSGWTEPRDTVLFMARKNRWSFTHTTVVLISLAVANSHAGKTTNATAHESP